MIGTDADFSWSSINGTSTINFDPVSSTNPALTHSQTLSADTNWIGTTTTRLGLAASNWMFYSKIGIAWAHTNYTQNNSAIANGSGPLTTPFDEFDGTGSRTLTGWTVGTGVEWAFFTSWTARLEYDFLDFGSNPIQMNGVFNPLTAHPITNSFVVNNDQKISEVNFGLSYKLPPGMFFGMF